MDKEPTPSIQEQIKSAEKDLCYKRISYLEQVVYASGRFGAYSDQEERVILRMDRYISKQSKLITDLKSQI